ncbi:sodium-dependent glucose transporter 1A [Galendromus occidentalis]|uniref:Major facilitator superfamily domain-containing protein 4A n=1 Tax=Galendromus occidentalis TaxID=34638 RepID=A0AAJ6W0Y8_9ACAR|nr:sodium-dependent glucose transporter 1A [Galendromus occidentalis]
MTKVSLLRGRHGQQFLRYFQTFHLLMSGITMGLVLVLVGPTLLDLADILQVSVRQITFVSFGCDLGAFIGSALALVIYKYVSAQKVLISSVLLIGISNILIPNAGSPTTMAALTFCVGMSVGVVEIGAYIWIIGLWPDNVAPITQMLHLAYGIGAFMSPLIAEPYLRHHEEDPDSLVFNSTEANKTEFLNDFLDGEFDNSSYVDYPPSLATESRVYIPYALIGAFALFNAGSILVSYCLDSRDIKPEEPAEEERAARKPTSKAFQWSLVSLVGFYIMVLVVLEVTVGKFLATYVVQHFGLDRSIGAYLVSLFYIGFTSGRVVAVPLSLKFTPMQMMNAAQALLMASAVCLTVLDTNVNVLWICFFTLGLSMAPMFGCCTAWLSAHVTLSHDFMSVIMTIATFGAIGPPLFVGSFIESHPYVLTYFILLAAVCVLVTAWSMGFVALIYHKRTYRRCPVDTNEELHKLSEA